MKMQIVKRFRTILILTLALTSILELPYFCALASTEAHEIFRKVIPTPLEAVWEVKLNETENGNLLRVRARHQDNKTLLEVIPEISDSILIEADAVKLDGYPKPLLLTQWRQGVHAHAIRIYDPTLGNQNGLLKEIESDTPVVAKTEKNSIRLQHVDESKIIFENWKP